jgi:hypothetical protein
MDYLHLNDDPQKWLLLTTLQLLSCSGIEGFSLSDIVQTCKLLFQQICCSYNCSYNCSLEGSDMHTWSFVLQNRGHVNNSVVMLTASDTCIVAVTS